MMNNTGFPERRILKPQDEEKLPKRALPFVGKEITVRSWHDHPTIKHKRVGWVLEFASDIIESDLEPLPSKSGDEEST